MKSIIKQPLVHFLLVGFVFFLLFNFFNKDEALDSKTVVVDKQALMNYFQYQSKAFNKEVFEQKMADMPKEELEQLIQNYIQEEVLYREAKAMGLDKEDFIIKRRMIQKVEFISQGIAEVGADLSKEEISTYYEQNKMNYYLPPYVTFTHIFFGFENWGPEEAKVKAEAEAIYINKNKIGFDEALRRGDRFLYHTNYVERNKSMVEAHFGPDMTKAVFEASPSNTQWIGPLRSEYGYHLVMVTKIVEGRIPELEEVIKRVTYDAQRDFVNAQNDKAVQEIIDQYNVIIELEVDGRR